MNPTALRTMLMGMVLAVQIATVVVVVTGMRQDTATQFAANARQELSLLADNVVDRTNRYLAPAESAIEVTRNLAESGLIDTANNEDLARVFQAQLETSEALVSIFIGRVDGSYMMLERRREGLRRVEIPSPNSGERPRVTQQVVTGEPMGEWIEPHRRGDPRQRPWYAEARQQDVLIWTSAYSFYKTRRPGISAARQFRLADGTVAGVLGVDVDIQPLSTFIGELPTTASGTAVILDDNHNAVAYSDQERLARNLRHGKMPSFDMLAEAPLKALRALNLKTNGLQESAGDLPDGFARLSVDGMDHLGMVRPISLSEGQVDWLLLVQALEEEYNGGTLVTIMGSLQTLIATILIPGIVAMFAIYRLTAPVFEMHENATTDHLTGALNRSEFERRLAQMMRNRREHELDTDLLVIALDLDGFKEVNDRFGHAAGDTVLRVIVSRLQRRVRKADLIGRIGGDEFMVALRLSRHIDQVETIRQIRRGIVSEPVKSSMGRHDIGVTAGLAIHVPGEPLEHFVERADHALVTGKGLCKNRLYVVSSGAPIAGKPGSRISSVLPAARMRAVTGIPAAATGRQSSTPEGRNALA